MADDSADVIVVGAGPSGATCAMLLSRAGHDVLLLDRAAFPRAKACGDCLSAAATGVLDRLGVLDAVLARRPARLEGWRIVAPDGSAFTGRFPAPAGGGRGSALALARDRLDDVLVDAAARSGARLRTGVRVTDVLRDDAGRVSGVVANDADGQTLRLGAKLVVGADGLRSTIARRLGLVRRSPRRRKLSLTAHVRGVAGVGSFGEMHLTGGACAGIAPAGERCNLTLVADAERFGSRVGGRPVDFFWRMLDRFPALAGRIESAETVPGPADDAASDPPPLLASGPFDWPTRDVVRDGAAVVGDASGYFDPFTGQGIFRALRTAEILADEADAALRRGPVSARTLRRYARRRARMLAGTRRVQQIVEYVTSRPTLAGRAIRALARSPATADALVAVTGDLLPARRLLSPRLFLTFVVDQFHGENAP